ncbi:MAG: hypothetical protein ABSF50_01985 [Burkholderiaceae bacterium]|jgi:hypothetical protein
MEIFLSGKTDTLHSSRNGTEFQWPLCAVEDAQAERESDVVMAVTNRREFASRAAVALTEAGMEELERSAVRARGNMGLLA